MKGQKPALLVRRDATCQMRNLFSVRNVIGSPCLRRAGCHWRLLLQPRPARVVAGTGVVLF